MCECSTASGARVLVATSMATPQATIIEKMVRDVRASGIVFDVGGGNMTKRTSAQKKDELLREAKDYVDPARKRRKKQSEGKPDFKPVERTPKPSLPTKTEPIKLVGGEIPRPQRLGLMLLAVQHSVREVSKEYDVPEDTIYGWFRSEGGIIAVKEYVASAAQVSFSRLIASTCDELESRMRQAPTEELFTSFREMLRVQEQVLGVGKKQAESERSPGPAQGSTPAVILQFNPPVALPPGSTPDTNGAQTPAQEDIVDGEVTDVFDDA